MVDKDKELEELCDEFHKEITDQYGDAKIIHFSCGWSGDSLDEGKCPKCGEVSPFWE